jgi:hypothetical protein
VRSTRSTRSASSPGATIVVSSLRPRLATNTRPGSLTENYFRMIGDHWPARTTATDLQETALMADGGKGL